MREIERLTDELIGCRAVLEDVALEQGIGQQWIYVGSMPEYDHVIAAVVVQAETEQEANELVLEWGRDAYPDENWQDDDELVTPIGPIRNGIWGGYTTEP